MKTAHKNLPAHYLDTRTQELYNNAVAGLNYHKTVNAPSWGQAQIEKELDMYYNQLEALDGPKTDNFSASQKTALRRYYKQQITQRLANLELFLHGIALTARAINCKVVAPQIL